MTERPNPLTDHPAFSTLGVDPLSDVLATIRLTGALFFLSDLAAPLPAARIPDGRVVARALAPNAQNVVSYHLVVKGRMWAGLYDGSAPVSLEAGCVWVVPRGDPYYIGFDPRLPAPPDPVEGVAFLSGLQAGALPFVVRVGQGADRSFVVCAFLGCDQRPFNPLVGSLPPCLVVRGLGGGDRLDRLIAMTMEEAETAAPGSSAIRLRLAELIFVETIRRHVNEMSGGADGWLAGFKDEAVGRAVALLHAQPARTWTLPMLAREAGSSRSALADRFTRLVGHPPMTYLTLWRMQVAAQLLADGRSKVSAVARDVGYDSEAAFSRAFKRATGVGPSLWRERRHAG